MPTHIAASISWQVDSMLPRDAVTINPRFRHQSNLIFGGPEWDTLATDLLALVVGHGSGGASRQITVKLYDLAEAGGPTPNRPRATKVANAGLKAATNVPGEVAICLSYAGGQSAPHQRGRLYIPYFWVSTGGLTVNRPSTANQQVVADLVPKLAGLGGVNVDWGIWSPTKGVFTKAESFFVDDEWDIQRRRGLKPTSRIFGTTGG